MNGGYQILDLRKIDIQIDDEEVAITDEDVLTQLRNLSEFLDIQTGLLSKQLKPIYILMDKSAGYGEINLVSEGTFLIQADFNNAKLSLTVVIGSDTDDDGNPYFYLDSAEYTYQAVSSGTVFYKHTIRIEGLTYDVIIIDNNATEVDTDTLFNRVLNAFNIVYKGANCFFNEDTYALCFINISSTIGSIFNEDQEPVVEYDTVTQL